MSRFLCFSAIKLTVEGFCHRRMGRGAGGGHVPPQNVYGRAKSNAKFGQNLKISEKF